MCEVCGDLLLLLDSRKSKVAVAVAVLEVHVTAALS